MWPPKYKFVMPAKEPLWTRNFYFICLAQIAMTLAFYAIMPVLPLFIEKRLQISGLTMGLIVAAYTATATLSRPFTGYYLDRVGRKPIYAATFCLFGLLFFFYPIAGGITAMLLLRLSHGLLWGSMMGAATTLAVDLIPPARRGEGLGMFGLTMNLGMALGPAIGILVSDWFGYDGLFIFGGLLVMAGFPLVLKLRAPAVALSKKPFAWKNLLEKHSLPIALVTLLLSFPFGGIMNYTAKYAADINVASGVFFLLLALGMAFARILAGRTFDRSGPSKAMAISFIFLIAGMSLQTMTSHYPPFYASALLIGMGYGIAIPVGQAMVNILVRPERRGAANATYLTAFDTGICLGIITIGHTHKEYGWPFSQGIETACFVLAAVLFWSFCLPHYRRTLGAGQAEEV